MLLVLAVIFATAWILAFAVLHVSAVAVHVLLALAVLSALVHTIHLRRYRAAANVLPRDAVR
jgi:hypothetical protein